MKRSEGQVALALIIGAFAVIAVGVLSVHACPSPLAEAEEAEIRGLPRVPIERGPEQEPEPEPEPEPLPIPVMVHPQPPTPDVAVVPGLDLSEAELDDELGRLVQTLEDGRRVVFTLDPALQARLEATVRRYEEPSESVVVVEPETGRVLAYVEDGSGDQPFASPASNAGPWAASVFKIITAAALIEEVGLDPAEVLCVPRGRAGVELEDLTPNAERDARCVDLGGAMAGSVNVYFSRRADTLLDADTMSRWLDRFGFNQPIPFEIENEGSPAQVPDDRLERARMAAGFRHSRLSPLHAALVAAAIANDGHMMRPALVLRVLAPTGEVESEHEPALWRNVMAPETARGVALSMADTTRTGTARRYFSEREGWPSDLSAGGKTGTLSNRALEGEAAPEQHLIYSWFAGFSPFDQPTMAVGSLVVQTERWYIKGSYLAAEAVLEHHRNATQ